MTGTEVPGAVLGEVLTCKVSAACDAEFVLGDDTLLGDDDDDGDDEEAGYDDFGDVFVGDWDAVGACILCLDESTGDLSLCVGEAFDDDDIVVD